MVNGISLFLNQDSFSEITDFYEIENAETKGRMGHAIKSRQLTQGIWNFWEFSRHECELLQEEMENNKAVFRIDGPKILPDGEDSQMMQFDIGYGKFGGGLQYRPMLDIKYTLKKRRSNFLQIHFLLFVLDRKVEGIKTGFDAEGHRVYGYLDFDISQLPDPQNTMITQCALRIRNNNTFKKKSDVRYYVELVEVMK